jgi:hypothetical protein
MVYYRGRIFGAGDSLHPERLYYSDQGAPEIWPSTNYIDINEGDGVPITSVGQMGNSIVIHKNDLSGNRSVWLLNIPDSADVTGDANWYVFKSPTAFSTCSDRSIAFFRNLQFFIDKSGAYAFTGEDIARTAADSQLGRFQTDALSNDIESDFKELDLSVIDRAASIEYDNKIWVALPYGSGVGRNNRIYTFDFVRISAGAEGKMGAWAYQDSPDAECLTIHEGDLLAGSSVANGYVYKLNTTNAFDTGAIDSYYWTAMLAGLPEHREHTKCFRFLYITHDCPGDWDMSCDYRLDYVTGAITAATVDLNSGGSLWGVMQWKNSKWGGGFTKKRTRLILPGAVGKSIQFRFRTNAANTWWKVSEIELAYTLKGKR